MKLNLTEKAKKVAFEIAKESEKGTVYKKLIPVEEAFIVLISDVEYKDLDNLCRRIQEKNIEKKELYLTLEECYKLTQGKKDEISTINKDKLSDYKSIIWMCANDCLNNNMYLGTNTINEGKINTSSWISHSIYESIAMKKLASMTKNNPGIAEVLGLLHDIGRKQIHDFTHTVKGFEELIEKGYKYEAVGTLTHSFINGGRCANCDLPEEGFYINKEGKPSWKDENNKDDITKYFLEIYKYSEYDLLLNIADLMATDKKIVSCVERVKDIRTRKPAGSNEKYFLIENIKLQNKILELMDKNRQLENVELDINSKIDDINKEFKRVSEELTKNLII